MRQILYSSFYHRPSWLFSSQEFLSLIWVIRNAYNISAEALLWFSTVKLVISYLLPLPSWFFSTRTSFSLADKTKQKNGWLIQITLDLNIFFFISELGFPIPQSYPVMAASERKASFHVHVDARRRGGSRLLVLGLGSTSLRAQRHPTLQGISFVPSCFGTTKKEFFHLKLFIHKPLAPH